MYKDTITAISTPIGEGGIGIVRLSGSDACSIVQNLFDRKVSNRRLVYGHLRDPGTNEVVDEVLVSYMAAPHTYTREDIVEINCHGGPLPLQRILELVLRHGARLANPGEFTLRAFINGRIDLAQAESVLDIIQARTAASLRLAVQGLGGRLSNDIRYLRQEILDVLAYLTARIDFPEDEVEEQDVIKPLTGARDRLSSLVDLSDAGIIYRQGVRTAIVGRPNVGKSSLLNRLLREDRAIVTAIPGTTRDTLEEVVNLKGIPFVLIDTAGITDHGRDLAEDLGIGRSRKAIERADLVLFVIDTSASVTPLDQDIADLLTDKKVVIVANKCDLPKKVVLNGWPWKVAFVSVLTGEGLAQLEEEMVQSVLRGKVISSDATLVTNPRHKEALVRALKHLDSAVAAATDSLPADFITIDLTTALNALGEITGETAGEELLEAIFSRFCIGK